MRSLVALETGFKRYLARLKATGQKRPSGRRKGRAWKTQRMWEKQMVRCLQLPPEDAEKLARELVEHLKEETVGDQIRERIKQLESRPEFKGEEIKHEIKTDNTKLEKQK